MFVHPPSNCFAAPIAPIRRLLNAEWWRGVTAHLLAEKRAWALRVSQTGTRPSDLHVAEPLSELLLQVSGDHPPNYLLRCVSTCVL